MHEMSLMQGVIDTVEQAATQAGALRVTQVSLSVGEMTEAVGELLEFAFDALVEDTVIEGAELKISFIKPRSRCRDCGLEFEHDRYTLSCPACESIHTELVAGRELFIDSIEVDIPDDEQDDDGGEG